MKRKYIWTIVHTHVHRFLWIHYFKELGETLQRHRMWTDVHIIKCHHNYRWIVHDRVHQSWYLVFIPIVECALKTRNIPRAARMPADQKTSPQRAGRKRRPPIREPYWSCSSLYIIRNCPKSTTTKSVKMWAVPIVHWKHRHRWNVMSYQ